MRLLRPTLGKLIFFAIITMFFALGGAWLFANDARLFGAYRTIAIVAWLVGMFALAVLTVASSPYQRGVYRMMMQRMNGQPDYVAVGQKIAEIEAEMRRAGIWQDEPLRPEQYNFSRAVAMDTMAFEQCCNSYLYRASNRLSKSAARFPQRAWSPPEPCASSTAIRVTPHASPNCSANSTRCSTDAARFIISSSFAVKSFRALRPAAPFRNLLNRVSDHRGGENH